MRLIVVRFPPRSIDDIGKQPRKVCFAQQTLQMWISKVPVVISQHGCIDLHGIDNRYHVRTTCDAALHRGIE